MRMTIKTKLVALLLIPMCGIAFLGIRGLLETNRVVGEISNVQDLSALAVRISSLVHETQKERGCTGVFMGSKGAKFQSELPAQRNGIDQRIADLEGFLSDFDPSQFDGGFVSSFNQAMGELAKISDVRGSVSDLEIPAGKALGYYTRMNGLFLDVIGVMTTQSSNGKLNAEITAYVNFLKGKERAGIERAVMSNTFAKGSYGPGVFRRFISLVTQQETYMNEFLLLASDEEASLYERLMGESAVAEVKGYRDLAMAKTADTEFGVDAGDWFRAITKKINLLKEIEDALSEDLDRIAAGVMAEAVRARLILVALSVFIALLSAVGGYLTIRSIVGPISAIVVRIKDIAQGEGDLTQRVDEQRRDELGELGRWFNAFVAKIQGIIVEVSQATVEVSGAATEIASSSDEMARGMDEQANKIAQISSAVEEMSASVIEVAQKSGDAAGSAGQSGEIAQEGGKVVDETIHGMEAISEAVIAGAASVTELGRRGEQIGEIIEVINDIADQTNLLALNAAIEAARAGEHGRGFAVVADEVRKLADRTTKATDEIGESIKAIQSETTEAVEMMTAGTTQVQVGVDRATEAGQSLERIVSSAQGVAELVQSIAAAAEEQSAASEEISRNVESVSSVIHLANEGVGRTATSAAQLSSKSEQLQGFVGKFKTEA